MRPNFERGGTVGEYTEEEQRKIKIATHSTKAVHQHVGSFAVSLIDIRDDEMPISSGTLIEIGNRLLVATAAHCIPANPNGRLWLLGESPRKPQDGMLGILAHGKHAVEDVGFLEIDPSAAKRYFVNKLACALNRLSPSGWGEANSLATVVGTPAARVDTSQKISGLPAMEARVDAYVSPFLPPAKWPDRGDGTRVGNEATSIVIEYPEDASRLDTGEQMKTYHPGGFSGGGIWRQSFPPGQLWGPDQTRMVGLQTGWYPALRCLHGAQIALWIQVVFQHYPDLQSTLKSQFPDIV
jgi:hypothetical protein